MGVMLCDVMLCDVMLVTSHDVMGRYVMCYVTLRYVL